MSIELDKLIENLKSQEENILKNFMNEHNL